MKEGREESGREPWRTNLNNSVELIAFSRPKPKT
jgi:hypothetical protein